MNKQYQLAMYNEFMLHRMEKIYKRMSRADKAKTDSITSTAEKPSNKSKTVTP